MKLLLVDDHIILRDGIINIFTDYPDLEVIGSTGLGFEAIQMAICLNPDVILMDINLPDISGIDATRKILAEKPNIKVIFLTIDESDNRLFEALRIGAKGYLVKNISARKLAATLRAFEHDEAAISRSMMTHVLEEFSQLTTRYSTNKSLLDDLTPRQIEILRNLALDFSNQEIAKGLSISVPTVKNEIHKIFHALKMTNRSELANFARHQGLIVKL